MTEEPSLIIYSQFSSSKIVDIMFFSLNDCFILKITDYETLTYNVLGH